MFTGLVREVGVVVAPPAESASRGVRLVVGHSPELARRLSEGASLCVAGVCLTVVSQPGAASVVELSEETVRRTRLARLRRGDKVNLEPALAAGEPLGGHWVQGHVDGLVRVAARRDLGDQAILDLDLPAIWARYVAEKGSVALDGVSLTVAGVGEGTFRVALIPHTLAVTTLGAVVAGESLHFEADILAKYVERALAARAIAGVQESTGGVAGALAGAPEATRG